MTPIDVTQLVTTYLAAWNEADESARRRQLEDSWGDSATCCDPTSMVTGREELLAHIAGFRKAFEGARIENVSGVEDHHGWFRFAWKMVDGDGNVPLEGFDVGSVGGDNGIERIIGFFGPFPSVLAAFATAGIAAAVGADTFDFTRWGIIVSVPLAVLWAIADIAEQPDDLWQRTKQQRSAWTFAVLLLGPLGVVAYYFVAHRRFERSAE